MYNTLLYLSFYLLFFSVPLASPCISFPSRNTNDLLTELSTFILLICIVQSGKYKRFYFWHVFMMPWKNFLILASSFFPLLCLFRCVCNIDCSQTNFNPLCASDGKSYDNACQIKEASCQKQEKIEVMSLGRCQGNSHNKTHFKECFQFLLGEKKRTGAGFLFGTSYISIRLLQFIL